jgi:copper transport protein
MRQLVPLAVAVVAISVAWTSPALAHAFVVDSEPAMGSVIQVAPSRVILRFSEPVELTGAAVAVTSGERAASVGPLVHPPSDRTSIVAAVSGVAAGAATVLWRVVGEDSHLVVGSLRFRFDPRGTGAASEPSRAGAALAAVPARATARWRPDPGVTGAMAMVRLAGYLGIGVLVGGVAFLALAWPEGLPVARTRHVLWLALAVAVAATICGVALQGAVLAGTSLAGITQLSLARVALSTRFGQVAAARVALLVLGAVLLALLARRPALVRSLPWQVASLATAAGLLRTPALLGHAAEGGPLRSAADLVHVGGASLWVGGLTLLVAVVLPLAPQETRRVLTRFSLLATVSVVAIVAAGAVLVLPVAETGRHVLASGYGRVLLLKLACVGVVLAAASQSRAWLSTRAASIGIWISAELGFALVALSLTAVLVGRTPPA